MQLVTRLWACGAWVVLGSALSLPTARAQMGAGAPVDIIAAIEPPTNHSVRVLLRGTTNWFSASVNLPLRAGDLLETGARCRVLLRFGERITLPVDQNTLLRIEGSTGSKPGVGLLRGILHFFHRGEPEDFDASTPTIGALIRGTDFQLAVAADGTTSLNLFDGVVEMTNAFGRLTLRSREAALVQPGQPPQRTAFIEAHNLLQWRLYYPAVLDLDELRLSPAETAALRPSLQAYRAGDLLAALASYPAGRLPTSDDERLYLTALLLSVGRVDEAGEWLDSLEAAATPSEPEGRLPRLAAALRELIAAVKYQPVSPAGVPTAGISTVGIQNPKSKIRPRPWPHPTLIRRIQTWKPPAARRGAPPSWRRVLASPGHVWRRWNSALAMWVSPKRP